MRSIQIAKAQTGLRACVKTKTYSIHARARTGFTGPSSGTALTYENYSQLVLSAAASYDTELLPQTQQGTTPPACHSVYMQDLMDHRDSVHDTVDDVYDIDTDIDVIQANVSNQQHAPGSQMPFPHWKSLSLDTQSIWDTISDSDKRPLFLVLVRPLCDGFASMILLAPALRSTPLPTPPILPLWTMILLSLPVVLLTLDPP
jgi:hypothetical protein